jgi:hypothetical protein
MTTRFNLHQLVMHLNTFQGIMEKVQATVAWRKHIILLLLIKADLMAMWEYCFLVNIRLPNYSK